MIILTEERKKLYLYAGINFLLGIIIGIILFYGQMKSNPSVFQIEYTYDKTIGVVDLVRTWWMNVMWLFATLLAHGVIFAAPIHAIVAVRGCVSSYGTMYLMECLGVKEAVISVLPQCFSIFPLMMWFSVNIVEKRRHLSNDSVAPVSVKRRETVMIFLLSMAAAGVEIVLFMALCQCLY